MIFRKGSNVTEVTLTQTITKMDIVDDDFFDSVGDGVGKDTSVGYDVGEGVSGNEVG